MTSATTKRWRAGLGAGTALILATVGFAPAAQADGVQISSGTLQWNVSEQVVQHLTSRTVSGAAIIKDADSATIAFGNATGTVDDTTGAAEIEYSGTYTAAFAFGPNTIYSVTIADPAVTINSDGTGHIAATVSSDVAEAYQASQGASTEPTDVTVVEFTDAHATVQDGVATFTATPEYADVIAPGSATATELGLAANTPYGGQSFNADFLGAIAKGIRAHFVATADPAEEGNVAKNEKKRPSVITGTGPALAAAVTLTDDGASIAVTGTGYRGVTNPGDAGVYIGVAPAGGLPDVSTPEGAGAFAVAAYVPTATIASSVITRTVTVPADKIEADTDYSVYTWQSHTHSNTSQDVEVPVTLVAPEAVQITTQPADSAVAEGATATFQVVATGDELTYQWQSSTDGETWTDIAGATEATYTTPATVVADSGQQFRVVVSGAAGEETSSAATLSVNALPIVKVAPTVTVTVPAYAFGTPGTAKVTVTAQGVTPTGTVTLTSGTTTLGTGALVDGAATIAIAAKALRPGTAAISAAYAGDAAVEAGTAATSVVVAKAGSTVKAKAKKKIKAKKVSKVKVTVKSGAGVSLKGQVTVTWKGTKGKAKGKTVTKKATVKKNGKVTVKSAKLKKRGTYKVTVSYAGNANVAGAKKANAAKVVVKK